MIQNPQAHDKQFKQMYMDAQQFSLYKKTIMVYICIVFILASWSVAIDIYSRIMNDWYEYTRIITNILQLMVLLYFIYIRSTRPELHYVSTSSNIFASTCNIHILCVVALVIYLLPLVYLGLTMTLPIRKRQIKIGDLVGWLVPFSFTFFYMIYYNYANKRAYEDGNILKFKKENGNINVYTYNRLLHTPDKLLTSIKQ